MPDDPQLGTSKAIPERGLSSLRAARVARLVLAAVAVAVAVAFATLSALGYETLKDHLDPLSVDRDAALTRAEFGDIVWKLRLLAGGLLGAAFVLVRLGRGTDRLVASVACSWWGAMTRAPRSLRVWASSERPAYLASFSLILVVSAALRIAFLDVPMRYDEATTYDNFVSKPVYVGLAHYPTPNNHVLHTLLAKISVAVFGNEPWAVRLPALLAGMAIVVGSFALGRMLFGRTAALLAAALVGSSSTLVEYSTNARGYTIVTALGLAALIAAMRALEVDSAGSWATIAAAGALGLYAVPIMLYPLGGVLLWLLISRAFDGRPLRPFLRKLGACAGASVTLALLLYAPVLAASGIRSVTSNEFVRPRSWTTFLDRIPTHVGDTVETWTRDLSLAVTTLLAVALVVSLVLTPRLSRFPIPPLVAIVAWTVPVVVAQRVVPFTRVWLFLVPVAFATATGSLGWLLDRLPRSRILVPVIAGVVSVSAAWAVLDAGSVRASRETGALLDAPAVAALLASRVEPGDRIVATGSDTILEYYLERTGREDAGSLLYTTELQDRIFVVVNVLGGQTLEDLLRELDAPRGRFSAPRLVKRYRSALVYVLERRD